ncbi:MAG: alanine racemase [Candidatus Omnitrophica bacterium]|nr:alanine racemase [Candidatus Omnitrophota bacterium]
MHHHTRICINLRAYKNNLKKIASLLSPACRLCVVLKADAYGHGLKQLAPAAHAAGVDAIAIADNEEAEIVRQLGIPCSLIRLRPSIPEEVEESLGWGVQEIVGSLDQAVSLSELGQKKHSPIPVHLAMDVGIGRMGFSYSHQKDQIARVRQLPGLRIVGVMTHFPCADEEELSVSKEQWSRFNQEVECMKPILPEDIVIHIANSAAILRMPESHHHMVRLGIASYGLSPSPVVSMDPDIQPVMSVVTQIMQIRDVAKGSAIGYGMTYRLDRDSRIAVLPIGYANGYLRAFSNKTDVLIRGTRCPVVGRISMNMTTVDVGRIPDVQPGDDAVLLGSQGAQCVSADELARCAGTINYEIACLLGNINREYRITIEH